MFAPLIDSIIDQLPVRSEYIGSEIYHALISLYQCMSQLQPGESDELRSIWLEVQRGSIDDFGDFESYRDDGEVETYDDFIAYWKDWYPDETKWYELSTAKYKTDLFFYLNSKLIIQIPEDLVPAEPVYGVPDVYTEFFIGIADLTCWEINRMNKDAAPYQDYIVGNLPFSKRFGRILRKDYWEILGNDAIRQDVNLGEALIGRLSVAVREVLENEGRPYLPEMTSDDFLRYCEICYDANNYFGDEASLLSPREKYWRMADGRHGGLLDIMADSPGEFACWYRSGAGGGGHPWEICRGGNSTHVSLYVSKKDDGWCLTLAGSSVNRVEETVRMAVALFDRGIPFDLRDAEEILRMARGEDYIGIVPETVFPRYCHSLFPKADRIIDFMNLGWEYREAIVIMAFWYPLELSKLLEQ